MQTAPCAAELKDLLQECKNPWASAAVNLQTSTVFPVVGKQPQWLGGSCYSSSVSHKSPLDGCWRSRSRRGISKTPPPREKSLNASHATRFPLQCIKSTERREKGRKRRGTQEELQNMNMLPAVYSNHSSLFIHVQVKSF